MSRVFGQVGVGSLLYKIQRLYGEEEAKNLAKRLKEKDEQGAVNDDLIRKMNEVLDEQNLHAQHLKNVIHQQNLAYQSKINFSDKRYDKNTNQLKSSKQYAVGDIDLRKVISDSMVKMGVNDARWDSDGESFSPESMIYFPFDSDEQKKAKIKNNKGLVTHVAPARGEYMALLHQARHESEIDVGLQSERLWRLLEHGQDLSEEEKRRKYDEIKKVKANARFNKYIAPFTELQHQFAIVTGSAKSDPANNPKYQEYKVKQKRALTDLVWQMSQGKPHLMKQLQAVLDRAQYSENDMFSAETFDELSKLIAKEVGKSDEEITKINEELNKLNAAAFKDAEKYSKESDEMLKYRVLQVALLVTPFAGLSLLGPIFGAASSIMSGGVGGGFVDIISNFPILGDVTKFLRLDDFFSWLLQDSPILGQALSVVDNIITSPIVQTIVGNAAIPLLGSALAPMAVGMGYSVSRVGGEAKYFTERSRAFKDHEKALNDKIFNIWKKGEIKEKHDFHEFSKEKLDIFAKEYEIDILSNFIEHLHEHKLHNKVFDEGDIQILKDQGILKDDKIDSKALKNILSSLKTSDSGSYQDLLNRFFAVRALDQDSQDKDLEKIVEEFVEKSQHEPTYKDLIKEGSSLNDQDFVFQMASARKVEFDKAILGKSAAERKGYVENLRGKIEEKDALEMESMVESLDKRISYDGIDVFAMKPELREIPSPRPRSPSLSGNPLPSMPNQPVRVGS